MTDREALAHAFEESVALHERVAAQCGDAILEAAAVVRDALLSGHTVLVFGNGGSAADAQHLATELVGRVGPHVERRALPVIALSADVAVITAVANDFGYAAIFARQIEALGTAGDVAFALTTSGGSANVNEDLRWALDRSLRTIALTGGDDGGESGRLADVHVHVPHASAARVQEVQRTILHVICDLVERHPQIAHTQTV
jgi:D-sedoheptulose 7-phosphate isomerase